LVTGVINRESGLLAKQITTLDVLSGGGAGPGVGAAWNEDESRGLGFTVAYIPSRLPDPFATVGLLTSIVPVVACN